jgi:hypothetical protein
MEKGFVKLRFNMGQAEAFGCEVDDDRFEPVAPARCLVALPVVGLSFGCRDGLCQCVVRG